MRQSVESPERTVEELSAHFAAGVKYHDLRAVVRSKLSEASPSPARFVLAALRTLAEGSARVEVSSPAAEAGAAPALSSGGGPSRAPLVHLLLESLACVAVWTQPKARFPGAGKELPSFS